MKRFMVLVNVVCVFALMSPVLAHSRDRNRGRDKDRMWQSLADSRQGDDLFKDDRKGKGSKKDKRAKVEKRLETMLMWRLGEELDLDEETGSKFFPVVKKYEKERREIHRRQRKTTKSLRKALKGEEDEKLPALLAELRQNVKKTDSLKDKEYEELKGVLSTKQLAKYILFRREFNREIRKIVEARHHRDRKKGPDHRVPRYEDEEDD